MNEPKDLTWPTAAVMISFIFAFCFILWLIFEAAK